MNRTALPPSRPLAVLLFTATLWSLAMPAAAAPDKLLFVQRVTVPAGASLASLRLSFTAPENQPPPARQLSLVAFTLDEVPDCAQPFTGATPLVPPGQMVFEIGPQDVVPESGVWVGTPAHAMIWKRAELEPPLSFAHGSQVLLGYEVLYADLLANRVRPAAVATDDALRSGLVSCDGGATFQCLGMVDLDRLFDGTLFADDGSCPPLDLLPCEPFVRFEMDTSADPR